MNKLLTWGLIAVAFIGLADSGYLSAAALTNTPLNCGILDGCNAVAQSPYSKVFGIPLALFGLVYYIVALALAATLLSVASLRMRQAMLSMSVVGVLFSAYFMYIQYFLIGAVCLYCVISAIATILLLALSFLLLSQARIGGR